MEPQKSLNEMSPIEMIAELETHRKYAEHINQLMVQNHIMRQQLMMMGFTIGFMPELPGFMLPNNEDDENEGDNKDV